jgi:hypothetical protein
VPIGSIQFSDGHDGRGDLELIFSLRADEPDPQSGLRCKFATAGMSAVEIPTVRRNHVSSSVLSQTGTTTRFRIYLYFSSGLRILVSVA